MGHTKNKQIYVASYHQPRRSISILCYCFSVNQSTGDRAAQAHLPTVAHSTRCFRIRIFRFCCHVFKKKMCAPLLTKKKSGNNTKKKKQNGWQAPGYWFHIKVFTSHVHRTFVAVCVHRSRKYETNRGWNRNCKQTPHCYTPVFLEKIEKHPELSEEDQHLGWKLE